MTSSQTLTTKPFTDWLDVTFAPTDFPYREISNFLHSLEAHRVKSDQTVDCWSVGDGKINVESRQRFARVSASGASLVFLRSVKKYTDFLSILADSPHRVTRIDAAIDVFTDAAPIIKNLRRKYPVTCKLSQKPVKTKTILAARPWDEVQSGTFYVGRRGSGDVRAKVYDKALEAFERRNEQLPPTARYEVTVGKGFSPTLRDAADPTALFWHFASPALLKAPKGVPQWESKPLEGWSMPVRLHEPAEVLKRRIESSPDLRSLVALAWEIGPNGPEYMESLIHRLIHAYKASDSHSETDPVPSLPVE